MAKRGDQARESVKNTIVEAFSNLGAFVCIQDKKIYVTAKDGPGGETLQFAIAMTMPKTPVAAEPSPTDWTNDGDGTSVAPVAAPTPVALDPADKAKVEELKRRLGVS